jgi:hypothetical protein
MNHKKNECTGVSTMINKEVPDNPHYFNEWDENQE